MSRVEFSDFPPEIMCMIGGNLNHRDLISLGLTCSWDYGVLYHNIKRVGPKGRCIICSKQIRCTKHSQKKRKQFHTLVKHSRDNLVKDDWNVAMYLSGIKNTTVVINKRWKVVYPCGCRAHPRCKQTWDIFHEHVNSCQRFVRYCTKCGRTTKECGHPVIGKLNVFRYKC